MLAKAEVDLKRGNIELKPEIWIQVCDEKFERILTAVKRELRRSEEEDENSRARELLEGIKEDEDWEEETRRNKEEGKDLPGKYIEKAILACIREKWRELEAGKLRFKDFQTSNYKEVTNLDIEDWGFKIRKAEEGGRWETRGRSRSRASRGSKGTQETLGTKGKKWSHRRK